MSDPTLLVVGIVVFALMLLAIVFTFLEFRQLSADDASQRSTPEAGEKKAN
mgnify:FL=1|jgi:hypothetical protein